MGIGFLHTILGPDHYLPFVAVARARGWSLGKTLSVTVLCGFGHVLGSMLLGLFGIALGVAVFRLEALESIRGEVAAWMLIAFGFTYFIWGLHRAVKSRAHSHEHAHRDGIVHSHEHTHLGGHTHPHTGNAKNITPWILFTIFVFGPCEPLIPLLMYPAAQGSLASVLLVAAVFGAATVLTMATMVASLSLSISRIRLGSLESYSHALALSLIHI